MISSLENLSRKKSLAVIASLPLIKTPIFSSSVTVLKDDASEYGKWDEAIMQAVTEGFTDYHYVIKSRIQWYSLICIGGEILILAQDLQRFFGLPLNFTKDFINSSFFTSRASLNKVKVVTELVKHPSLDLFLRYKIACHYGTRKDAWSLWHQLSKNEQDFKQKLSEHSPQSPVVFYSEHFEKINSTSDANLSESILSTFLVKSISYWTTNANEVAIKENVVLGRPKELNPLQEPENQEGREPIMIKKPEDELKYLKKSFCSLFNPYLNQARKYFEKCNLSHLLLLTKDFVSRREITMFLYLGNDRETFLRYYKLLYGLLRCFLIWPYQDLFMITASPFFHILRETEFYSLLHDICDASHHPILKTTYNYRVLLEEFWIKSPHNFKKFVIDVESRRVQFDFNTIKPIRIDKSAYISRLLLEKLLLFKTISPDVCNFHLILKTATTEARNEILHVNGDILVSELLRYSNFKLANFYISNLSTDENIKTEFRKDCTYRHILTSAIEMESFDLADRYINWAVSPDEVENLKQESFRKWCDFSLVGNSFLVSKCSIIHLNEVFDWLGISDVEIEEWKRNGSFIGEFAENFLCTENKYCTNKFDLYLEFLGFVEQKNLEVKKEFLDLSMSRVILGIFSKDSLDKNFKHKLLYLCSNSKEQVHEYINDLHTHCEEYIEEKLCLVCKNDVDVVFNEDESKYLCELHPGYEILTSELVEKVCSSLLKELLDLLSEKEKL